MKRILTNIILLSAFGFLLCPSARAIGLIIVDEEQPTPSIAVPNDPRLRWPRMPRPIFRYTPLEIRSAKVTGTIKDQVAHTKIEEEFYNPNPNRLEGTFILPLPKGAHLNKFAMEINGKMAEAELLSADKAKGIYEEIVRKAKDPALLEYVGRDLLKVRIFPIEPNSTKKIELSYDQILKNDSGMVEYGLPLNTAQYAATPIGSFGLKITIDSSTPLKTIYSPSHSVEVLRNTDKTATIGLEEQSARPEKDFQLFYSAQQKELGVSFLTYKESGEEGYFMLLASPGFKNSNAKILPKDVVFVLDTSGSMAGKKLAQAKKALVFCVNNLNPEDHFEIIRFSTETESLFKKLTKVSDDTRHEAETFVENLKTIGGTAINDALKKALEIRPKESTRSFLVVFLTDGLPTVGDTSEKGILKTVTDQNRQLTRIFCFGIGTDVNTRLLDRIAEETSAVSQYVLPDEDIEVKVSSFFSKISDPVLAGVELDFGKIRTSKIHPGKLPDLFKGQQLIVLGRYSGSGSTKARITGKVGERDESFSYPVEFPDRASGHNFIPRLWATRRVGYLLDEIRLHGENSELKEEITDLARKYSIPTPYTSFLVQEDQPLAAAQPARDSYDPLAFYRRDPELMKRSFPQLYRSESSQERERVLATSSAPSGDAAVADSRYSSALKTATSEEQLKRAGREVQNYAFTGKLQASPSAATLNEFLTKTAAGRTFEFQNGAWTETVVAKLKDDAKAEQIRFDSPEYWSFASAHPDLSEILALGTNVKFTLGGKLYEIIPAKP
jgi:Ca-activated chloride channel family protein